jgi:thiamine biosynthesis lipoprotein
MAKGYATDCAADALRRLDIRHAIINAGGNVYALGRKPDGNPWRVGIRHPREEGALMGVVEVMDQAVVSSGDYERFFEVDGRRYHHILDPNTGMPSDKAISATVIASRSISADLLSTAVFVLGRDAIWDLLPYFEGVEALVVDEGGMAVTPGSRLMFSLTE